MAAGVLLLAATPGSAAAQAWIGLMVGDMMSRQQAALQERACMSGTPMPEAEIAEARQPATRVMQAYWASVAAGEPANVGVQFHLDKKSRWTAAGQAPRGMTELSALRDPFAGPGRRLEDISFVRAGDGSSARGQWRLRDTGGRLVGTYVATFGRKLGEWRLSELTLVPRETFVEPLAQYCHKLGDVMPYRLSSTEAIRAGLEKRAVKADAKAKSAETAAAKDSNPKARDKATKAAEAAALRREELAQAVSEAERAKADAESAREAEAAARAAHQAMLDADKTG